MKFYQLENEQWVQVGDTLLQATTSTVELSYNGSRAVIGTTNRTGGSGLGQVYEWDGIAWSQVGEDITAGTPEFGFKARISGDGEVIAICDPGLLNRGGVSVYRWQAGNWTQLGRTILGEAIGEMSCFFGEATGNVSCCAAALNFDGSIVAVGAPENDAGIDGGVAGHVRVHRFSGTNWVQIGQDIDADTEAGEQFGW